MFILPNISIDQVANVLNYKVSDNEVTKIKYKIRQKEREKEIDNFDKDYLIRAPIYERVRERYFVSPYLFNYAYVDLIDEPTLNGRGEGCRAALKFQLSLKYPLFSYKYYHSGVYFAMTFRALFDLLETENSQPMMYKNYQPELFFEYDLSQPFGNRDLGNIPDRKHLVQFGAYHLSNGGAGDTSHAIQRSRSLLIVPYGQYNLKLIPAPTSGDPRSVYSELYQLNIYTRFTYYIPKEIDDNKNILKYIASCGEWGFDFSGTFEHIIKDFGVVGFDLELSPKKKYLNHGLGVSYTPKWNRFDDCKNRLPITIYIKYFQGYNEYLELYFKKRTVFALGFKFRP